MQNKILNNAIWMIGGQVVKTIISLVVSVLTARYLGPSNYGIIGYVSTFIIVLTAFSNLGLGSILIKEFVHKKENSENVIKTCIVLQLISSSISYIVAILLIFLFNINNV